MASDLPGVRVPATKTGAGLIIPVRDSQALAEAIIAILENPDRYRGQPENLLRLSTPQAVAEEYERIFELARSGAKVQTYIAIRQQPYV